MRRAVAALVSSGSDLWLVESREALRSLAAPRLGELTEERIADAALESALEGLVSGPGTTEARSEGGGGLRLASSFLDRTHALAGRALLRPLLPRPVRGEAPRAAFPTRRTTIPGGGGTGPATDGRKAPATAPLPWKHLDAPVVDLAGTAMAGLPLSGPAASVGAEGTAPERPAETAGGRPFTALVGHPGRAAADHEVHSASPEHTGARRTGPPDAPTAPQPRPAAGNGLTALVDMWYADREPRSERAGSSSREALPTSPASGDDPRRLEGEGRPRSAARSIPSPPDPVIMVPLGGGGEAADLDAEALVLDLIERALRSEARRHGVALDRTGLL